MLGFSLQGKNFSIIIIFRFNKKEKPLFTTVIIRFIMGKLTSDGKSIHAPRFIHNANYT